MANENSPKIKENVMHISLLRMKPGLEKDFIKEVYDQARIIRKDGDNEREIPREEKQEIILAPPKNLWVLFDMI